MIKRNKSQAIEFKRMADIYLGNDAGWKERVEQQKRHIKNME